MSTEPSLFERIGGETALFSIVAAFYDRVYADPSLAPFFKGIEREKLQRMFHEFVAVAVDGPIQYTGRELSEAHHGHTIRPAHLQAFVAHLKATLHSTLSEQDAYDIITRINHRADPVIGRANIEG
jgi:hemoglobin